MSCNMADMPDDIARLIVQATVPAHGPIVRFTFDLVSSSEDDGTGEIDLYPRRNASRLCEFRDNSGGDPSWGLPSTYRTALLGHCGERLPVYVMFMDEHGMNDPRKVQSPDTVFHNPSTWSGQTSNGQLVIMRHMELVSAGTWQPTAAERALFTPPPTGQ